MPLKEVSIIKINSCTSSRKDIKLFLEELQNILNSDTFDIDKNLLIIKSKKDEIDFSTNYTILDLEYNSMDIVERLKELTISEYSETLNDRDDDNPPKLFVFGKDINGKLVYIKLKIKENVEKRYCVYLFIMQNMT